MVVNHKLWVLVSLQCFHWRKWKFLSSSSRVRELGSQEVYDLCGFQRRCYSWGEAPFHLPALCSSLQSIFKIPCCCPQSATWRLLEAEALPFRLACPFSNQVTAVGMAEVPTPAFPALWATCTPSSAAATAAPTPATPEHRATEGWLYFWFTLLTIFFVVWREKQEEYPGYPDLGASSAPAWGAERLWAPWVGMVWRCDKVCTQTPQPHCCIGPLVSVPLIGMII